MLNQIEKIIIKKMINLIEAHKKKILKLLIITIKHQKFLKKKKIIKIMIVLKQIVKTKKRI